MGNLAIVEVNKEKPGKGNFIVRVKGVENPIVCLTRMARPFSALKALDMDKVASMVLDALKARGT